jgi:hypothetical protein
LKVCNYFGVYLKGLGLGVWVLGFIILGDIEDYIEALVDLAKP